MKTITVGWFVIMSLFFTNSYAGDGVGNGGDGLAAEFILTAKDAFRILKNKPESAQYLDLDKLSMAIANTKVSSSKEPLILNGIEVDAINYPRRQLIVINRARWLDLRHSNRTLTRFNLVVHEYLGIMGIDDHQYNISESIVKIMNPSQYNTSKFWKPMNPTNNLEVHVDKGSTTCSMTGGIVFDLIKSTEHLIEETCDSRRKVEIIKTQGSGGWSDGTNSIHGTYHAFTVKVLNDQNELLGSFTYVPEFGNCLISDSSSCSQSGSLWIDNVSFRFFLTQD
jgi:hypothetical protein